MKVWIAAAVSVLCAGTAWSADPSGADTVGHWYVSPEIGATITNNERNVDDGPYYGLAVGKHLNEDWSAEINAITGNYHGRHGAPDLRLNAYSADVLRVFDRDASFSPFLTAGAGVIDADPSVGPSHSNFMMQGGIGALIHAWDSPSGAVNFSIRPVVKLRWDMNGYYQRPMDVLMGLSFELAFGAPRPAPAPAPVQAAPPPPPAAVPPPPPPKPAVVDSDGDGVPDGKDQCPNTPHGTAVDAVGCPLKGSITLVGVHFETNSAQLTSDSSATLDPLARDLRAHPHLVVEVQGHTDGVGSAAYNLALSKRRANAVRDYLIHHGVSLSQLIAKGYGKTQPIADNRTAAGRALNRRVVMKVLENPGDVVIKRSDNAP